MIRMLLLALLGLFTSCKEHSSTTQNTEPIAAPVAPVKDSFKVGEVIPMVHLRMDPGQTFALYLPQGYTDSSKLPAIIFFDPHGDGTVPLNLYHQLADKYHYILIGSNTSRNGMPLEQSQAAAFNLFNEARTRFSTHPLKVAYCGFSGGAKVALLGAASNPAVANAIYIGSKIDITPNHPLALLGFDGLGDMNYTDLIFFERDLANKPVKHYLVEFKGKHEFPAADVFNDAFIFLNTGSVENYEKKRITTSDAQIKREQDKKNEYLRAFKDKDTIWWKKEIANLNANKKADITDERLLGFLSLAGYSLGGGQLEQNKLDMAEKILTVYKLADPENKDCDSMLNVLKQKRGMQMGPR